MYHFTMMSEADDKTPLNGRSFPLAALSRLRMMTDGEGVTTLAAAAGCPLECRYCINPEIRDGSIKPKNITAQELLELVRIDSLYFIATGGGITFGGGEPLLYAGFIKEFRSICPTQWRINAETSLYVPEASVRIAAECTDRFYVDIKDINPGIYGAYTGGDVRLPLKNLKLLIRLCGAERITVRLPLIPGFNTDADRDRSEKLLSEMGITRFDRFEYKNASIINSNK